MASAVKNEIVDITSEASAGVSTMIGGGGASTETLHVTKRDGSLQIVSFDKITTRLSKLAKERPAGRNSLHNVDIVLIAEKVISQIYDRMPTEELDKQSANVSVEMTTTHPEYSELASRIIVSNF